MLAIEISVNEILNPFYEGNGKFFMDTRILEEYFPNFPNIGYESEAQAKIALVFWQVNPTLSKQELYASSKYNSELLNPNLVVKEEEEEEENE